MKKMTVRFMVEFSNEYDSDMEYKVVESYTDCEYPWCGYDIYEVETDNVKKIRVIMDGVEYMPLFTSKDKDGIRYVDAWTPVE